MSWVAKMPVMKKKCSTCPFGETDRGWRDVNLAVAVTERTLFKGQQICHHPRIHGKKETHRCRGSFDHNKEIYDRLGLGHLIKEEPMETIHLCKCNNCEETFVDTNPQIEAKEYPIDAARNRRSLVQVKDEETEEVFWACPNCKTDAYLTDI